MISKEVTFCVGVKSGSVDFETGVKVCSWRGSDDKVSVSLEVTSLFFPFLPLVARAALFVSSCWAVPRSRPSFFGFGVLPLPPSLFLFEKCQTPFSKDSFGTSAPLCHKAHMGDLHCLKRSAPSGPVCVVQWVEHQLIEQQQQLRCPSFPVGLLQDLEAARVSHRLLAYR